jgi:Rhs element Vgr protein
VLGIANPSATDNYTFTLVVNGTPLPTTVSVLSIDISRSLNSIACATIACYDGDVAEQGFALSSGPELVPGNEIEILGGYSSDEETLFKGIITRHQIRARRRGESQLIIEARDAAYKMTLSRKSAYFRDTSDSDIFEQIINGAGLTAEVATTTTRYTQVVQYQMTDWDFVLQRAERLGFVCATRDGTFAIEDPASAMTPAAQISFGTGIFDVDLEIDGRRQPNSVEARAWDYAGQAPLTASSSTAGVASPGNLDAATLAASVGESGVVLRHGGAVIQEELDAWASGSVKKARLAKVRGTVSVQGTAAIVPGKVVDLSGLGDRFSGPGYVSGVQHRLAGGDWRTTLQIGLDPVWHYERYPVLAYPGDGLNARINGLQTGVVTEITGDPTGEGRIRVRLPLISEDEGLWARSARLDAGNERGIVFNPEVDDEVVVGFVESDPNQPVVLGMLHSSAKTPPIAAEEDNFVKGIVTREKLELKFNDEDPSVTVVTPNGNKVVLSDADATIVVEDESGNKVTLSDAGVAIESPGNVELRADGDVTIDGTNIKIKSTASLELEGGSGAKLSSGGTTDVKGSLVQIN